MGVVIVEKEGAILGLNLGRHIVTNGDFATRLFPNYSGQYLLSYASGETDKQTSILVTILRTRPMAK